jgi:hypothetical protein
MRRAAILAAASGLAVLALLPGSAAAHTTRSCGQINGVPIHAHNLSCSTARHIYRADMAGNLPAGWSCSASLARCYRGEVGGSSEYM